MPFLFLPNIWHPPGQTKPKERAHNDGILVNSESPEEFDEYFFKVFLDDKYIKKSYLKSHKLNFKVLKKYLEYIKLICLSKNKERYISKNNNNILRFKSLIKIENSFFFFLIRSPLDHASSLLKLHKI